MHFFNELILLPLFRFEKWIYVGKRKRKSENRIKLTITDTAGQEEMTSLLDTHLQDKQTGRGFRKSNQFESSRLTEFS